MYSNSFPGRDRNSTGFYRESSMENTTRQHPGTGKGTMPAVWREHPEVVYHFLSRRPDYEQLCQEIAYVLKRRLENEGIEYSSISCRAKDLDSFLEKLERKKYPNPFSEITDFAGVRVVCLYPSDLKKIEAIMRREFEMVEVEDKNKKNGDHFGYLAVHYLVKLGNEFSGARYDHLKNLVCEIQTRTVLQHAWALIDQHLVYKKTSQIPEHLRYQIAELSQVLEEADQRFENIRQQREEYVRTLERIQSEQDFLSREINLDSFKIYSKIAFPGAIHEKDKRLYIRVLKWIDPDRYSTLGDIHRVVQHARPKLPAIVKSLERVLERQGRDVYYWTDLDFVHLSLGIADYEYRSVAGIPMEFYNILQGSDDDNSDGSEENYETFQKNFVQPLRPRDEEFPLMF